MLVSGTVPSPCVSICALDENDVCIGCHRSGMEIARWGMLTDAEKRDVLEKVARREQGALIGSQELME
ncbi:DUF1289 domain-containing protein [Marinobacteraceae bacterium S3BR75-40.1]